VIGLSTGAVIQRELLGCIRRFHLRARLGVSVIPFLAPAASHAACRFPALRASTHFVSKVMKPIWSEQLSVADIRNITQDFDQRFDQRQVVMRVTHENSVFPILVHSGDPFPVSDTARSGPVFDYLQASIDTPWPAIKSVKNQTLAVLPPTTIVRIFCGLRKGLINVLPETFCQVA
jgi:hypothetical protein